MASWEGTRWIREPQLLPRREARPVPGRRFGRSYYFAAAAVVGTVLAATIVPSGHTLGGGLSRMPEIGAAAAPTGTADGFRPVLQPAAVESTDPAAVPVAAGPTIQLDATSTAVIPTLSPDPSPASSGSPVAPVTGSSAPSKAPAATPTPSRRPAATTKPTATPKATAAPTPVPTSAPPAGSWVTVVSDGFDSGSLSGRWQSYDGPYGSGPGNCAVPSHAVVADGYLHLVMSYETSASLPCGPGWYTGGVALRGYSAVDQRVTVRFRVVDGGAQSHFIIPMRWPDNDSSWPAGGEEDFCETDTAAGCTTYLHYGSSNSQSQHSYGVDLSQWHTLRFQRFNHTVSAFIDNMSTPVWTFNGNSTTLPDTLKHVVLQQECHSSCPAGTAGGEDIQIDWITVENVG